MRPHVLLTPYRSARLTVIKNSLWVVSRMDLNTSVRKEHFKNWPGKTLLSSRRLCFQVWHNSGLWFCSYRVFWGFFFSCFWSQLIWKYSLLVWLFNRRLTLTHRRNQTRHVFYDLVNEQRCCETCVWALGGGRMGVWCLIGIHLHPSPTHPFVYVLEHSPESNVDRQESVSTFPEIPTNPFSLEPERASSHLQARHCSQF